jgi:hypothetical protein
VIERKERWMVGRAPCLQIVALVALVALGRMARSDAPASKPAAPPTGTLRAESARFRLTLISGATVREVVGERGVATLPAGSYYLLHSETEFADKAGRVWRVRNGMSDAPVVIRAGRTTTLALGAPLETRLTARVENGKLIAEAQFWGPLGDKCEGVVVEGSAVPAPRVRIVDASGQVLGRAEGSFCCKFTATVAWPLPAGMTGRLRVFPEIGFGPVGVWSEAPAAVEIGEGP